jgi:hypothetical protein
MSAISIIILTQQDCAPCKAAKAIVERLARKYSLSVSAVSLDSPDGVFLAEEGGVLFPPGIFINGKLFSYGGLSERMLRIEIERLLSSQEEESVKAATYQDLSRSFFDKERSTS